MNIRSKTIVCDIDGTLIIHKGNILNQHLIEPEVLPGVHKALRTWETKGYTIILTTGRRESTREQTIKQLAKARIIYDHLIMGVATGIRVVINDKKPDGALATRAINVDRNIGFEDYVINF